MNRNKKILNFKLIRIRIKLFEFKKCNFVHSILAELKGKEELRRIAVATTVVVVNVVEGFSVGLCWAVCTWPCPGGQREMPGGMFF